MLSLHNIEPASWKQSRLSFLRALITFATIAGILFFAARMARVADAAPARGHDTLTAALPEAHPTPTFTFTPGPTDTYTSTPTPSPTSSFTNTPTNTPTPLNSNTPTPTPPACQLTWQVVNSLNGSDLNNYLMAVAAVSASDVWAVGYFHFRDGGSEADQSLVEHWDGTRWSIVPSPNPGLNTRLYGVTAISASDVWAVGLYANNLATLTIHWNGSYWTQVPSPSPGNNYANWLNAVSAVSSDNVWAVGFWRRYSPQALIEHYDGSSWSQVTNPTTGSVDMLNGVKAVSANDVWAVGLDGISSPSLVAHWDGRSWTFVPCPSVGELYAVDGIAANDLWAVGASGIVHWDGTSWTISTTAFQNLNGVTAISTNNVWAVGNTAIVHWDGATWSTSPDPVAGPLKAVAAVSSSDIWAVGSQQVAAVSRTLVERYNGPCATPTATLTPTAGATATFTPTSSPTAESLLVGHVTWQGRLQPDVHSAIAITLTLRAQSGGPDTEYTAMTTDPSGYFTVPVGSLAGNYNWRVKDPKYLASSGSFTLTGAPVTNVDMGLQLAGDCNNDNVVNASDFPTVKNAFGKSQGQPGYDDRADLNGDLVVNSTDFTLLKVNFGTGGAPPVGP